MDITLSTRVEIEAAADRLVTAARTGAPCQPVRDLIGSGDIAAAYAVQELVNQRRAAQGARVVGRKVGLTSPAVQAQLGVDRPDLGVLFADMEFTGDDDVPAHALLQPRVEAEVAFILGADLDDDDLSPARVRSAVDHVCAAIEICDSRIAGWDITFGDTVADNASAGAFVLGNQRRTLRQVEPREVQMHMSVSGQESSEGSGAACLGDPIAALTWLARTARELGDPLRAGQVVLSGALGPMRPIAAGGHAQAHITGLGDVAVQLGRGI